MPNKSNVELLIGQDIMGLTSDKKLVPLSEGDKKFAENLSKKEKALHFNGFLIIDENENIIFEDRKRYSQHFFPLSVLDYAKGMYHFERDGQPIPIFSVDSHDVLGCDFDCQDCLSGHGTNFPVETFPKDNFKMDLQTYQEILREIAEYSKARGFTGVRFEQSGEGNPDFYPYRKKILEYAKNLEMQNVYISTGSKINDSLRSSLVENTSFIRISFPGIGEAYTRYSGQNRFNFENSLRNIELILNERTRQVREKDLMVGVRVALREGHSDSYFNFANRLKNMGIDSLQIVKILVPENMTPADFPLPIKDISDLEKTMGLDDLTFNVLLPHNLDYMVYSREIQNRDEFPPQCFSALFQPVLTGRSLFVCTTSEQMYSSNLRLGTFNGSKGELKNFLSNENMGKIMEEIPFQCKSCSNIYDNMLLFSLQKLFKNTTKKLKFYEIIK